METPLTKKYLFSSFLPETFVELRSAPDHLSERGTTSRKDDSMGLERLAAANQRDVMEVPEDCFMEGKMVRW